MKRTYPNRPVKPGRLAAELVAALPALRTVDAVGIPTTHFQLSVDGNTATLDLPDGTDAAAVDAVLAAHDGATPEADEVQATQDASDLADLRDQAATLATRLDQIVTQMQGSPTNAQVVAAVRDLATGERRLLRALGILVRER